jgi:4'-phosphopantetheinyl transferase
MGGRDGPALRDRVEIWLTEPDSLRDPAMARACAALLSEDERQKAARYLFERDRDLCLASRALLRTALSRHADVAPQDWRFVANEHGCPRIAPGVTDLPLRFNLSHTEGLVACAITLDREIGVDVETLDRKTDVEAVSGQYLAPDERASVLRKSGTEQRERFYQFWTLKEAYIKAREKGLAIPLSDFAYRLEGGPRIEIAFAPSLDDDAASWQFLLGRPTERHILATAVRRGPGPDLEIERRWTVPIVGDRVR